MKRKYITTVCVIILLFFLIIFGLCKFADILPSKNGTLPTVESTENKETQVDDETTSMDETTVSADNVSTASQLAANGSGDGAFAETMSAEEIKALNGESDSIPETAPDGNKLYMSDTTYDGKTELSLRTFEHPFDKTSEYQEIEDSVAKESGKEPDTVISEYVNNKTFLKQVDEEKLKEVKEYANNFIKDMFATDYHTISQDKAAYVKKLSDYFDGNSMIAWDGADDSIGTPNEYFDKQAQWFIDNEVEADVKWVTDDSLIWSDHNYVYIRGELTVTPYSCKAKKTTGYMPTGVDYVNGSKSIIELQIGYYGGDMYPGLDQFQIKTYDCLGEA